MIAFAVIGGIGLLLLVVAMLLDGVADVFNVLDGLDALNGILSATAIGSALTLVGACGLATLSLGGPLWLAVLLSIVLGAAGWFGVARLSRALRRTSNAERVLTSGATGRAASPIDPLGEILVDGEYNKRLARTDGPAIPAGAPVRVVDRQEPYVIVIADETSSADPTPWPTATPSKEQK